MRRSGDWSYCKKHLLDYVSLRKLVKHNASNLIGWLIKGSLTGMYAYVRHPITIAVSQWQFLRKQLLNSVKLIKCNGFPWLWCVVPYGDKLLGKRGSFNRLTPYNSTQWDIETSTHWQSQQNNRSLINKITACQSYKEAKLPVQGLKSAYSNKTILGANFAHPLFCFPVRQFQCDKSKKERLGFFLFYYLYNGTYYSWIVRVHDRQQSIQRNEYKLRRFWRFWA